MPKLYPLFSTPSLPVIPLQLARLKPVSAGCRLLLASVYCLCSFFSATTAQAQTSRETTLQLTPELASPPPTNAPLNNAPRLLTPPTAAPAVAAPILQPVKPTLALTQPGAVDVRDEDAPRIPTIDLVTPPNDLLQRLRNGFSMPDLHSPLVTERQAWYLNNPTYIKRVIERSRPYLHHIINELEKRGMPTELALLPIVESSFNPLAYSRARALGMWQFIPSTGKNYRLQQNWWLDQRRDIIASTNAALDYLQTIYEMHGDWHLALASYNWGEGAVGKAIAKNKAKGLPTDYLSLSMPGETRYYVPKLQAIKNIIAQPEVFGLRLDPIPNRPYFGTVDKPGEMDISLAAKLAEMPVNEFIALNPAYQRPVMPGNVTSPLIIPVDKVQTFITNLENHEAQDKPLSAWQTYSLKKGEKLEAVANRNDIAVSRLKQINGIGPRTKVGPGFNLLIPGKGAQLGANFAAQMPSAPPEPEPKTCKTVKTGKGGKAGKSTHCVSKGDKAAANTNTSSGRKQARIESGKVTVRGKGKSAPASSKKNSGKSSTKSTAKPTGKPVKKH